MTDEIRRRKTGDPEMDAIVVLSQALSELDTRAAERVLKWATEKYVTAPRRHILEEDMERLQQEFRAYKEYAASIGAKDTELVHALAHVRSVKRLAPIDQDDDPTATENEAKEKAHV